MGMTLEELRELLDYIEEHHSRKNMYELHMALPPGTPLQKIITYVDFTLDTRDYTVWTLVFRGIIGWTKGKGKDEMVFTEGSEDDLKERIYTWLKEA